MSRNEKPEGPENCNDVVQLKLHGGLGDCVWVYKKFHNHPKPLFLHISDENRARPRRSGILADHLPNVAGWRFDATTFCPGGQDWGPATDPACAIGRTWAQIEPEPGQVLRLECNRHLEGGQKLADWLPDLPTTHHFEFRKPDTQPQVELTRPYVVFHLAGWPDVLDDAWVRLIQMCEGLVGVYIVGGTYDRRPTQIATRTRGLSTLLTDLPWADVVALLSGATYCFGHASGLTAIADVLRVPGVVVNPRQHPRLVNTWNDPEHKTQVHCSGIHFEPYTAAALSALTKRAAGVWPPKTRVGLALRTKEDTPASAVRAAVMAVRPRSVALRVSLSTPVDVVTAAVTHAIANNIFPKTVTIFGGTADHLAALYTEVRKTSRPPVIEIVGPDGQTDPSDLVVYWAEATTTRQHREAWQNVCPMGTLLVVGPDAANTAAAAAAALRITPEPVDGCSTAMAMTRGV